MARTVEFGIDGIKLKPGDHVCGLFFGWFDRDELMVPFFRTGLRAGDRCIVVTDRTDPAPILGQLGTDTETEQWLASGRLQLWTSLDQPEPTAPRLHHDEMLATWQQAVAGDDASSGSGFSRIGGEVSWWTPTPSPAQLGRYEAELNHHIGDEMAVLCLYDLSRFSSEAILNAVMTHPVVLVGDRIVDNRWYVSPQEYLALDEHGPGPDRPTMRDIGDMINQRALPSFDEHDLDGA